MKTRAHQTFPKPASAFTILEVMVALFIFGLVLTAIYSTWLGIMRGTRSGLSAAAAVQRSRIAIRTLEDAFLTMTMFHENIKHYYFITKTDGDLAEVSLVSRLPASFPGVGRYGDQVVRRVSFYTEPGTNGAHNLIMSQAPMLLDSENAAVQPYTLVLSRDVSLFTLEFYDLQKDEWLEEWKQTNQLPKLVRITLGQGKSGMGSDPADIATSLVSIPGIVIGGMQGGPMTPMQGVPGAPVPGAPGVPGVPGMPGQPGYPQTGYPQTGFPGGYPQPGYPQPGQPGFQRPLRR